MAAVAAPVAAKLQQAGHRPLMIAVSSPPTHEADWLISLVSPKRTTVFAPAGNPKLGATLEKLSPEILKTGSKAGEGSLLVAKHFWKQSRLVVAASTEDPEGVILGGSLAAALSVPLLVRDRSDTKAAVTAAFAELGVQQAIIAVSELKQKPRWANISQCKTEVLDAQQIQHQLATALGPEKIHNIIVARVPERSGSVGRIAWLAPFMSASRGSAVVLTHRGGHAAPRQ